MKRVEHQNLIAPWFDNDEVLQRFAVLPPCQRSRYGRSGNLHQLLRRQVVAGGIGIAEMSERRLELGEGIHGVLPLRKNFPNFLKRHGRVEAVQGVEDRRLAAGDAFERGGRFTLGADQDEEQKW